MSHLFAMISETNREAARCEALARRYFDQAKVTPTFEGRLIDAGVASKLKADRLRTEARRLLRGVPHTVCGQGG